MSDAIVWDAPDGEHPARAASRRSYAAVAAGDLEAWLAAYAVDCCLEDPVGPSMFDPEGRGHHGHAGLRAFWAAAISPVASFRFVIRDSHANGATCANVGTITTTFPDGGQADTDLVMVYVVDEAGLITSMRAYWEPDRVLASYRPSSASEPGA